jgi:hypothetical protein
MRLMQKQSHSINRGMSDVLRLIAHAITKDIGTPYRDYDAIDLALRTGKPPVIFQKPYDMKHLMPLAESVANQAVSSMKEWLEAPHSLQNIILVGGGAFMFRKAVKAAFPRHRIHEVKEPLFANVRGFQLAGQNYARSVMAARLYDELIRFRKGVKRVNRLRVLAYDGLLALNGVRVSDGPAARAAGRGTGAEEGASAVTNDVFAPAIEG